MMHILNNVPNFLLKNKRVLIGNQNGIERSIKTVFKMIPASINAVIPYYKHEDPWWPVRNIVTPITVLFAPHYLLLIIAKVVFTQIHSHHIIITTSIVLVYFFIINVQWEFASRYLEWTIQEEKMAHAEKIMKEEQKLD
jgi:hypothetical protein